MLPIFQKLKSYVLMASMFIILLFFYVLCAVEGAEQEIPGKINLGSSLFPTSQPTSWFSPSGRFAFGFYQQDSGFAVGIWLVGKSNRTVVWTANRNDPPVSASSTISLTDEGKLLYKIGQGGEKLIANNTEAASFASLQDSGNLVLYNAKSEIIWESFKYPTDTILGGQTLFSGAQLVSSSETSHHTGRFHLKMQEDGNLVLYPLNTGDTSGDAYWRSGTLGHEFKFHLYLNSSGRLLIVNGTSSKIISTLYGNSLSANDDNSTIYRATLDIDGVLRLYSHRYDESGELKATTEWEALKSPCEVKSFCGFNSYCTYNDDQPVCLCLPGSDFIDPNHRNLGCTRNYTEAACKGGKQNPLHFNITTMENINWGDIPYVQQSMSIEECRNSCLEDCNCGAALFSENTCKKQRLPLRYVIRKIQSGDLDQVKSTALLKVGIGGNNGIDSIPLKPTIIVTRSEKGRLAEILMTCVLVVFSCISLIVCCLFIYKIRSIRYKRLVEHGEDGLTEELKLRLFSYDELKAATNGFREELGKGSFGAVYKGTLYKRKKLVAVKRLEKLVEEGEREFQAEMRAIGRTHHKNLVRLLGYCAVDSKRLLVYEYMSNGSLANLVFNSSGRLSWNQRIKIAIDVAKGIHYLHEECETPIIHCDIKPQNILMDEFWTAKIADFGLAKLLMPDQTRTFTVVRGTRGYLAPEWHKNTPISVKADIYSYGIVLLEIVCCRKNMELNTLKPEEIVLSTWVYNCFVAGELEKLVIGEEADKKILEKMVMVAMWCIQDEPALRPSMKSVVLMLEGITDVSVPPCPTAPSM
ncbi:G-type lectin S-receptor-like serine/threonine-protein kinase LECRK2 isoform X1 [Manihot esculenta]|uniref:G-type lectin S-receptor-like serine/threonine-protein kinase LECRK2 isoform X1 n=1 Tax=Manihot esculenta TaxID=3983 RepID=UPI001CC38BE2|nr:G-type lectin S-receptor-like serine/threonine-protein kinase LECRK2 isoform X1 [Manihot esculenta]